MFFLEDFYIHWNIPTDSNTLKLNDIFGSFRLKRHISLHSLKLKNGVTKIMTSAPSASCAQDLIHTWILKQCKDELLPTITEVVNLSLISGKLKNK